MKTLRDKNSIPKETQKYTEFLWFLRKKHKILKEKKVASKSGPYVNSSNIVIIEFLLFNKTDNLHR